MADIFVSYAREDRARVAPLVGHLESQGWTVFWDRHIPPGASWREVLEQELAPAGCVVVLWSAHSVGSRWVLEEAEVGAQRRVLIPARLDDVSLPLGFTSVQTCDLSGAETGDPAAALDDLVGRVNEVVGRRQGVSLTPRTLHVVLGRPARHPDLGAAVNLVCSFHNDLGRDAELRGLTATVRGPTPDAAYDLDWRLLFDLVGGTDHRRRVQRGTALTLPARDTLDTGIQLRAPVLTDTVEWPRGDYRVELRGWIDRERHDALPNLRCTVDARLDAGGRAAIERHLAYSDDEWVARAYSDDAYGVPLDVRRVRQGRPAA